MQTPLSVSAGLPLASALALRADVWSAHALGSMPLEVCATGERLLDAELPGGGWPLGALIEILQPPGVHNEWRLLLPALVHSGHGPVVLVGAPHLPFAPALAAQGFAGTALVAGSGGPGGAAPVGGRAGFVLRRC